MGGGKGRGGRGRVCEKRRETVTNGGEAGRGGMRVQTPTHTHTHTHSHTLTYAHTGAHTRSHRHSQALIHMYTSARAHMHMHARKPLFQPPREGQHLAWTWTLQRTGARRRPRLRVSTIAASPTCRTPVEVQSQRTHVNAIGLAVTWWWYDEGGRAGAETRTSPTISKQR